MVKINRLEIENVKRVQAVQIEPAPSGLTVIGGKNGQGKTSVLDAILWAIGGNKFRPSRPKREDSSADPRIRIEMDNGLVVTREGKNASLKVIDAYGRKAGQTLLDELIGQLALNLPAFMHGSAKDKAETLLQVIGVGDQLAILDREADRLYNERHLLGQTLTRKKKHAEDLPFEQGVPEQEVSASELIQQQQAILARNGENHRLRARRDELAVTVRRIDAELQSLRDRLHEAEKRLSAAQDEFAIASKSAVELVDESTAELEASLRQIDDTNRRVRINAEKRRAEAEASDLEAQVDELTTQLETVRDNRTKLLDSADLPLPDLSVENGELTYRGQQWDCMSSSDQLRVAVAIARKLRPECHFVLLDKTEQMDLDTLREFGAWLESEGLQVIATRVSTGAECSIVIEDGLVAGAAPVVATVRAPSPFDQEGF
jgi:predicted ATP-dependent endonuclease of OLD family